MKTVEEIFESIIEKFKILDEVSFNYIDFISNDTVFATDMSYSDARIELNKLRPYKLVNYYIHGDKLVLTYNATDNNIRINFFINKDIEDVLKLVSSGKCKITTIKVPKVERKVITCNNEV